MSKELCTLAPSSFVLNCFNGIYLVELRKTVKHLGYCRRFPAELRDGHTPVCVWIRLWDIRFAILLDEDFEI